MLIPETHHDNIFIQPSHLILVFSNLYLVPGTLQANLDDEETSQAVIKQAASSNLETGPGDCIRIFNAMSSVVGEYKPANTSSALVSNWQRLKWTFKQEEVAKLREELTACKIILNLNVNLAVSVANL